jgi:uncharacterized protein DUF6166
MCLWVHADSAMRAGRSDEARRVATFLADQTRQEADRLSGPSPPSPEYRQLGRLITAVARWCEHAADLAAPPDIPPPSNPESLAETARRMAGENDPPGMIYRGVFIGGDKAVHISERDGSQRLLRDAQLRARGKFTWGYHGTGPHDLAEALISDVLDPHTRCPACLGAAPCGADVVHCGVCYDTGLRQDIEALAATLVERFVSRLPQQSGWELEAGTLLGYLAHS